MSTQAAKITESVVEQAALGWLESLDYQILAGPAIAPGEIGGERESYADAWLAGRLRGALGRINPAMPAAALEEAERKAQLTPHPTLIENNREFHRLMVEGVDVEYRDDEGAIRQGKVWIVDWAHPETTIGWRSISSRWPRPGTSGGRMWWSSSTDYRSRCWN